MFMLKIFSACRCKPKMYAYATNATNVGQQGKIIMEYDAVVVGAGHNGLAAAVELASKGWTVAVVEARDEAGGAVKTREVTLPGFRHDLCAMNLSMFAGSAFFNKNKD